MERFNCKIPLLWSLARFFFMFLITEFVNDLTKFDRSTSCRLDELTCYPFIPGWHYTIKQVLFKSNEALIIADTTVLSTMSREVKLNFLNFEGPAKCFVTIYVLCIEIYIHDFNVWYIIEKINFRRKQWCITQWKPYFSLYEGRLKSSVNHTISLKRMI